LKDALTAQLAIASPIEKFWIDSCELILNKFCYSAYRFL
jgi:hypothetical protein